MKALLFGLVLSLLVLLPAAAPLSDHHKSDQPPVASYPKSTNDGRVAYYRTSNGLGTPTGACGYAKTGVTYNYGNVAAASSKLWRNGASCGACYNVKCAIKGLCNDQGVDIVVTDRGDGDNTDFILSSHAFEAMALPKRASQLVQKGVVDVQYERIPCHGHGNKNLMVKVTEQSRFDEYLSIVVLYQGGQYDLLSVQVYDGKEWKEMRAAYGAVFDLPNPPKGPISLKLKLKGRLGLGGRVKVVKLDNVIPRYWKAGVAYDSKVKLA